MTNFSLDYTTTHEGDTKHFTAAYTLNIVDVTPHMFVLPYTCEEEKELLDRHTP